VSSATPPRAKTPAVASLVLALGAVLALFAVGCTTGGSSTGSESTATPPASAGEDGVESSTAAAGETFELANGISVTVPDGYAGTHSARGTDEVASVQAREPNEPGAGAVGFMSMDAKAAWNALENEAQNDVVPRLVKAPALGPSVYVGLEPPRADGGDLARIYVFPPEGPAMVIVVMGLEQVLGEPVSPAAPPTEQQIVDATVGFLGMKRAK